MHLPVRLNGMKWVATETMIFLDGPCPAARVVNDVLAHRSCGRSSGDLHDDSIRGNFTSDSPEFARRLREASEAFYITSTSPTTRHSRASQDGSISSCSQSDKPKMDASSTEAPSSDAHLPSPHSKHDYEKWSASDSAELYQKSHELYCYHYQLQACEQGWKDEDWENFRLQYSYEMTCIEHYNAHWREHGPPSRPLPKVGEPLLAGGHVTLEWLAEATGTSEMQPEQAATATAECSTDSETGASDEEAPFDAKCTEATVDDQSIIADEDCSDVESSCGAAVAVCADMPHEIDHAPVDDDANEKDEAEQCNAKDAVEDDDEKLMDDSVIVHATSEEEMSAIDGTKPACSTVFPAEDMKQLCCEDRPTVATMAEDRDSLRITSLRVREAMSSASEESVELHESERDAGAGQGSHTSPESCANDELPSVCNAGTDQDDGIGTEVAPEVIESEGVDCEADAHLLASLISVDNEPCSEAKDPFLIVDEGLDNAQDAAADQALTQAPDVGCSMVPLLPRCAQSQPERNDGTPDRQAPSSKDVQEMPSQDEGLSRAVGVSQAEIAALVAQLAQYKRTAAEAQAPSEALAQKLHATEQELGDTKEQLRASAGRENDLKSKLKIRDLELEAWKASNAELRQHSSSLQSQITYLKESAIPQQHSPETAVSPKHMETSVKSAQSRGVPASAALKMIEICCAQNSIFSQNLTKSPTFEVAKAQASLLARSMSPRICDQARMAERPELLPSAGSKSPRVPGSFCGSPCHDARAPGLTSARAGTILVPELSAHVSPPGLSGHPPLKLRVTGDHEHGQKEQQEALGTWLDQSAALDSPSHLLSPSKHPHTPQQPGADIDGIDVLGC